MPKSTENLNLFLTDMETDGNDLFDFGRDLNENWNKIDEAFEEALMSMSGGGGYIGQLSFGIRTDVPEGQLRLDGATYSRELLPAFFDEYLVAGKIPTCTMDEYSNYLTQNNGNCGYIGLDLEANMFRMPTLKDRVFIAQALTAGDIAQFNFDQIVNITGKVLDGNNTDSGGANLREGAFYPTGDSSPVWRSTSSGTNTNAITGFDASKVVRTGDQVQPPHIQYPLFMTVSNVAVPASEAQYNEFLGSLESKANVDLTNTTDNLDFVVESWKSADGNSWYRKYKSGWIEQGGLHNAGTTAATINFNTQFTQLNYSFVSTAPMLMGTKSLSNITISDTWINSAIKYQSNWRASGY